MHSCFLRNSFNCLDIINYYLISLRFHKKQKKMSGSNRVMIFLQVTFIIYDLVANVAIDSLARTGSLIFFDA